MERVREALAQRGEKLSREAFAEKYGITATTYFNYRLGDRVPKVVLALWSMQVDTGLSLQDLITITYEEVTDTDNDNDQPDGGAD